MEYNAGGHRIEKGLTPSGETVYRFSDLYKFNPEDYTNRWIKGIHMQNPTRVTDFGLNAVNEATKNNVFLVRSPWLDKTTMYNKYGFPEFK